MPSFQTAALPLEGAQEQVTRQPAWISALLVLAAGYAHALSIAWPFSDLGPLQTGQAWGGLQIGSLAVLAWQLGPTLSARRIGQAAKLAWLFACAMLCGTFWWLYISMHFFGGLPLACTTHWLPLCLHGLHPQELQRGLPYLLRLGCLPK
jgi:apolipoprotein N-acyltransferase